MTWIDWDLVVMLAIGGGVLWWLMDLDWDEYQKNNSL